MLKFKHIHSVKLSEEDHRDIDTTAARLGLSPSEITRRALRIALPILRDLNIPGSPKVVKADASAEG